VKRPYPNAIWTTSSFVTPPIVRTRAVRLLQIRMSLRVYPTTVDAPVVPEEAWIRTTSRSGTAKRPYG
jgi:hypothetical protein